MKRITHLLLFMLLAVFAYGQQAKYVFYFIGDGMGLNQVNATEMYLAAQADHIGIEPMVFSSFPVAGMATTFSASNPITDSAAGGTALATGSKTYNGAIGVDKDKNPVQSVAEKAKQAGRRVGIATSVSVNHATPASFYAHQPSRKMYYEIGLDLMKAGFDFYAGSGFQHPSTTCDGQEAPSLFSLLEEAGYTLAKGVDECKAKSARADKLILIQPDGCDIYSLPYAIDRKPGDLTLAEITGQAVSFLTKGRNKGFFLMVEGGKIDWACHGNDAATAFNEVKDLDDAIRVAYDFYKQHPKETLIVVTADHETGGLGLGYRGYTTHLERLAAQRQSQEALSSVISNLRKAKGNRVSWDDIKELLGETMGFWTRFPLAWEQEKMLRDEYEDSFVTNKAVYEESMYAKNEPLAATARRVMNQLAKIGWTTEDHSAGYVPVFAIGAGSQLFIGKMDNTEIPKRIEKAMKMKN